MLTVQHQNLIYLIIFLKINLQFMLKQEIDCVIYKIIDQL